VAVFCRARRRGGRFRSPERGLGRGVGVKGSFLLRSRSNTNEQARVKREHPRPSKTATSLLLSALPALPSSGQPIRCSAGLAWSHATLFIRWLQLARRPSRTRHEERQSLFCAILARAGYSVCSPSLSRPSLSLVLHSPSPQLDGYRCTGSPQRRRKPDGFGPLADVLPRGQGRFC
jgi:hypothetical protein